MTQIPSYELPDSIETARLIVRRYEMQDAIWYHTMSLRNKIHLARYEAKNPVMIIHTLEDAQGVIGSFIEEWEARRSFFFAVFVKASMEFAGQIYLGTSSPDVLECEIGYFAEVDHQGKGYIHEAVRGVLSFAFEHLGAQRVRLECDDTNIPSFRVAEHCGFKKEGHIRQNKRQTDGTLSGTLFYGMLRSEFFRPNGEG
jgi:ribosomal-protein-alanine N-acetyltransferase